MSVRRLAEPSVQPPSFVFSPDHAGQVKTWIGKYPKGREQSAVIPLLMLAQDQEGWVSKAAIEHVADMLGMPYIRALEVATFYTQFQLKPVGSRAHVQVCGTTPCMLRGAEALMEVCRSKIHQDQFHSNAQGTLSWEEVECLGACVNAPMVMIFKDTYEDLTPERLGEIIELFDAGNGRNVPTGPQVDRIVSAPQSGLTTLRDEAAILKSTRDEEARAAAREHIAGTAGPASADTPPSNAGKPKTDAAETNPTIASPSPVKAAPATENSASVTAPAFDAANANKAAEQVENTGKQRRSRSRGAGPTQAGASPASPQERPAGDAASKPLSDGGRSDGTSSDIEGKGED